MASAFSHLQLFRFARFVFRAEATNPDFFYCYESHQKTSVDYLLVRSKFLHDIFYQILFCTPIFP